MALKINFSRTAPSRATAAVALVAAGNKLGAAAAKLDKANGGLIAYHLKNHNKFTGKKGQTTVLTLPKGADWPYIVLAGTGDAAALDALTCENAGGGICAALAGLGAGMAAVFAEGGGKKGIGEADVAARLARGIALRSYRFDKYKTKKKGAAAKPAGLQSVTVVTPAAVKAKAAYAAMDAGVQGVFLARDLANEPPNVLYPESFARIIKKELSPLGVTVEIFDEKKMAKLGFNTHLSVGQGSARPPRVVIMRWNGAKKKSKGKPLAFVGKGVTFDTGGISIKPSGGMEDMKFDMCGAAAVVGLMKTLARRRAKADVVGIVGLAENMPSDRACRPSDIVQSLSGQWVENLNTDAEGRLVLCDALTYVQDKYDPSMIVDLATLTGAIVVALGSEYAGAFANDDGLWNNLSAASAVTGERLWRMPLDEAYRRAMDSATADIRNTSTTGRDAGSCTAAGYLERFIDEGRKWAHLDIAGVAWSKSDKPTAPKPATGFGVLLLDTLVADHYE